MGNCKDCLFWKKVNKYGDGQCFKLSVGYEGDDLVLYPNALRGKIFITPELFGCNHFKAKE